MLAVGWARGSGAPCKWTDPLRFPLSPFLGGEDLGETACWACDAPGLGSTCLWHRVQGWEAISRCSLLWFYIRAKVTV